MERDLESGPSNFKGDNLPVEEVSWFEAVEFCQHLSKYTGNNYRLPSEAEWEYACRAGTITRYAFGDNIAGSQANFDDRKTVVVNEGFMGLGRKEEVRGTYRGMTTAVDSFTANAWGLYDMHGNVREWCQDYWHKDYNGAPEDGLPWTQGGDSEKRVCRGGSWYDLPGDCRSAYRTINYPDNRNYNIGFRVVCSAPRILP